MTGRIEKTVFISYRRTNLPWALAIYQNLTQHGYDVFFDYESISSGDFEQIILGNIKARAHFIVILTPSALERCDDPGDWLRREIETALDHKRNILPLMMEGFNFGSPSIAEYLTGKMALLKKYNGLNVPVDYFDEAMARLRDRYLNIALDAVLHPLSNTAVRVVREQQVAANKAAQVKQKELSAQEWFEKGLRLDNNSDEEIGYYTQAIRLKPDYPEAYYTRGIVRKAKGDLDGAIQDYDEAIRLKPGYQEAYINRGVARKDEGDIEGAIKDYNEAMRLKPDHPDVYYNRGLARRDTGDIEGAIEDYNEALRLRPDYVNAYWGRGNAFWAKEDYSSAAADYQKYFDLGGTEESLRKFLADAKKKIRR